MDTGGTEFRLHYLVRIVTGCVYSNNIPAVFLNFQFLKKGETSENHAESILFIHCEVNLSLPWKSLN